MRTLILPLALVAGLPPCALAALEARIELLP